MISGIFIYGLRGEVLASRIYKDGLKRAVTDVFRVQVISNPDCNVPILTLGSTSFIYIRHENLYIVAITRHDVDAALVYELLFKLVEIATSGLGKFDEAACTTKVHVVYELLSELVDFGYPQHTDATVIDQILGASGSSRFLPKDLLLKRGSESAQAPSTVSRVAASATPWRNSNLKYRQNEIYVDIIESINVVMSSEGGLISSNATGKVQMKTHLSGMPQCIMALNDDAEDDDMAYLEDFQMHQCVNLPEFSKHHRISFLPPDGEFELMKYSVVEGITLPFKATALVREIGKTHVDYDIRLCAMFPTRISASNVVIKVPVPPTVTKTSFKATRGKAKYNASTQTVDWRFTRISGGQEAKLTGTADVAASQTLWSRPPISVEFSISMYCSSGLRVQYLKMDDSTPYKPLKWVRYLTNNGNYEIRM